MLNAHALLKRSFLHKASAALLYSVMVGSSSAQIHSVTEAIAYHDDPFNWVIGQTASVTCTASLPVSETCDGDVVSSSTFDPGTAMRLTSASFGKLQQILTYHADGTVATVRDGNGNVSALSNWKRGVPQMIRYTGTAEAPSGATKLAEVDNNGWIVSVTDEAGSKTCYRHDQMGRIDMITFPSESQPGVCDTSEWWSTNIEFRPMTVGDWRPPGVEAGQWRQHTTTGNYRKIVYFDALWRPILSHEYDAANTPATLRAVSTVYDAAGRLTFESFPSSDLIPAAVGTWSFYDALNRIKEVRQDSEQGQLITRTEYLGSQVRVIGPNNEQTLTSYQAFDESTYEFPIKIEEPLGRTTLIQRDVFGKPIEIERKF